MQIKGKTIVITGAARGIGRALAVRFAGQGANIALLDLKAADLEPAVKQCKALGVRALAYAVDVSAETQVSAALDDVVRDFGALDAIINNAGIVKDALLIKVKDGEIVGKMTLQQWQAVIDVNLTGVFLCAREAAERMIKLAKGRRDREHLQYFAPRKCGSNKLHGGQIRRRVDDGGVGQGACALRHPGRMCGPRIHTHGYFVCDEARSSRKSHCAGAAEASRSAG